MILKHTISFALILGVTTPASSMAKKTCDQVMLYDKYSQDDLYHAPTIFESLGIHYDRYEYAEYPLRTLGIDNHRAIVTRKYYTDHFVTEVISTENKFGVSYSFAKQFKKWPKDRKGRLLGVAYKDSVHSIETEWELESKLKKAGIWNEVQTKLELIDKSQGKETFFAQLREGLDFYRRMIERRDWSDDFKDQMIQEAYDHAESSTFMIVRDQATGKVVGHLQIIRDAFGRRAAKIKGSSKFLTDETGAWGLSVRRLLPIGAMYERKARDESSYHWASLWRRMGADDHPVDMFTVPTERKMREHNLYLERTAVFERETEESSRLTDKPVQVFWGYGEVDEPAKFAIDPDLNGPVYVEILTHMLGFMLDPGFSKEYNLHNRMVITMSEIPQLYKVLGFSPTGQTMKIDGKTWHVLRASTGDLLKAARNFQRALDAHDLQRLNVLKATIAPILRDGPH